MNIKGRDPSLLEVVDQSVRIHARKFVVGGATSVAFPRPSEMDHLIGMLISVPDDFGVADKGCDNGVTHSSSVDVPLSLSNSGRHVRDRSSSMEVSTTINDEADNGKHQARRDSVKSLPAVLFIPGSFEDRFAGGGSTAKTDKGMNLRVKMMRKPSFKLHSQTQRDSVKSLPVAVYIGGSLEDRFDGGGSTAKTDKGMHLRVKMIRKPSFDFDSAMQSRMEGL
jgi:hypothetical protein